MKKIALALFAVAVCTLPVIAQSYDIVIKAGHVIDPKIISMR